MRKFLRPSMVVLLVVASMLILKYQNCAPTSGSLGSGSSSSTAPFPTGTWNGVTSASITSVAMNFTSAQPQFLFPGTQMSVSLAVQGTSSFNVEGGVIQNGQRAYFNQCSGSGSGTGTVAITCSFTPGTTGYTPSVSGNQNQVTVGMFLTVVDGSGNVLADCSAVSGVCTGSYSTVITTLPIGYQVGSNCYHLSFNGSSFAMAKPGATFFVNNPSDMLTGFSLCSGTNCCDNSGNCFNTAGNYSSTAPNTCL